MKETILAHTPTCEMIILYGSAARGNFVDRDIYKEDNTWYEYRSDLDILVITEDKKTSKDDNHFHRIEDILNNASEISSPVSIISHHIKEVNAKLRDGQYFFSDIKKEGYMLFDSGNFKLERRRKIDNARRAEIAKEDFEQWFQKANSFLIDFQHGFDRNDYNKAAFELHQATEHAYTAVLLVYSGYKPKIHNIRSLGKKACRYNAEFAKVFPMKTAEEKKCFKLLLKAYVDARYKKDYSITKGELEYLSERVKKLHKLTEKICKETIKSFTA